MVGCPSDSLQLQARTVLARKQCLNCLLVRAGEDGVGGAAGEAGAGEGGEFGPPEFSRHARVRVAAEWAEAAAAGGGAGRPGGRGGAPPAASGSVAPSRKEPIAAAASAAPTPFAARPAAMRRNERPCVTPRRARP